MASDAQRTFSEQLRDMVQEAPTAWTRPAKLMNEAADTIESLQAEVRQLKDRIVSERQDAVRSFMEQTHQPLKAEAERLRGALSEIRRGPKACTGAEHPKNGRHCRGQRRAEAIAAEALRE